MSLPISVVVVYPNEDWFDFVAPYNEHAVAAMKRWLPYGTRKWDPEKRVWQCRRDRLADFLDVIDPYYLYFVFDSTMQFGDVPQLPAPDPYADDRAALWAKLGLVPDAPPEVVKAAYRALAMVCHPDRGGDPARMAEVNTAYAAILAEIASPVDVFA